MDRVCQLHSHKQNHARSPTSRRKAVLRLGEVVSVPGIRTKLKTLQSRINSERRLRFNVGGIYFEILKENLARFPDTLLGGDRKRHFFDKKRNEYFFDRDPVTFKYILDFYRTGKFHISTPDCMESIRDELAFFGIPEAFVSECCCEHINFEENEDEEATLIQKNTPDVYGGKEKLYEFLTNFKSSFAAAIFSYFFVVVVIINICLIIGETLDCTIDNAKCGSHFKTWFFCIDSFCVAVFTFEFFSRLYSCPDRKEFIKDYSNIVDLIGILPYYFGIAEKLLVTNSIFLQSLITTLRIFRIFRVIKLARHSEQFQTLLLSIGQAAGELGGILFSFLALMVMFSTIIFTVEDGGIENNDGFTSIPAAFWYTLVTMTTLGYGDIFPATFLGKVIGSTCALAGVVLLALPVPIIEEKLNANKKKLSRKKDEKPFQGLKLSKRFAASMASLSRLKSFKILAGLTSHASQSSAMELSSCNNINVPQEIISLQEKESTDYSSDETIKATFIEMSDVEPVQIHQPYFGDVCSPNCNSPKYGSGYSNERLNTSLDSISSDNQDEYDSMKTAGTEFAIVKRKPYAHKRRSIDSENSQNSRSLESDSQENRVNFPTADLQNANGVDESNNGNNN